MHDAIEQIITFACDHPAMIGMVLMVWGCLAGWFARMEWDAHGDETMGKTNERIKERGSK